MKKITLFILTVLLGNIVMAQLPANEFFRYEFTNGSNANTAFTSAAGLTNTFVSIADRNSSAGDAANLTNQMNGANLGGVNYNNSTLSFWLKTPALTSTRRVLQMYGTNGNGYRVELNTSSLMINARVEGGGSYIGGVATALLDLDDNAWHHIVVRTAPTASFDAIIFELDVDGVSVNLTGNNIIGPSATITNFLLNATFVLDPLNGFTGNLDDIYGYRSTLTNAEVTQLYNYYPAPPPTRYYVDQDATGNNDGSSWNNAFTDLQNAFNYAYEGMEIWVADGTYKHAGTNRNLAFLWEVDSLEVYGGFNGTETMLSQRDWMANRTIMSGDIGTQGDIADNCYAVFVGPFGSSTNVLNYALLDGFVIQDGNANANLGHEFGSTGSGFFLADYTKKVDLHNCELSNNNAKYSAVFSIADYTDVELNIDACIFKNNSGRVGTGLMVESAGEYMSLNVTNSLFTGNECKDMGSLGLGIGSIVWLEAKSSSSASINAVFNNTTFANNPNNGTHAGNTESTITYYNSQNANLFNDLIVNNCIFWGNTGDTKSIAKNPNGGAEFMSVTVNNTISEFTTFPSIATTSNVTSTDPLFTNATNGDFTLQNASPAIDAGFQNGLVIPAYDLAGNARVVGTEIDLGCYEASCGITVDVSNTGDVLNATTGFSSYQWYLNGTAVAGATSADLTPAENGLIYVEVTDNGCTESTTPTLYCLAFPDVIITQNGNVLETGTGFTTYDWSLDGVLITGENSNTLTVTQDGEYKVEVTDQYGCGDFTTFNYCSNVSVVVTANGADLTATSGFASYQWLLDGTAISGATSETYTAMATGNYSCEVTDNGCTSTSNTVNVDLGTAIRDLAFQNVNVYPNPTRGIVSIQINEDLSSIRLLDLSGRTIQEYQASSKQINIAAYNPGIYFLELTNEEKKSIVKIIKK